MRRLLVSLCLLSLACAAPEGSGLALSPEGAGAKVKFDVFHKPLPDIPLPNDFASRYDPTSFTKKRVNASQVSPTEWETKTRQELDALDGWGTLGAITVSFDEDLDTENVIRRHWGDRFDTSDDVILVIDVTKGSPDFCKAVPLDLGEGHFPARLDRPDYYPDDPRGGLTNLLFEEVEEDLNGNGVLDPGEDTDMDGVLDHPNTSQRDRPPRSSPSTSARPSTLIARPCYPLREAHDLRGGAHARPARTRSGTPVRSPFATSTTPRRRRRCSRSPTSAWASSASRLRRRRLQLDLHHPGVDAADRRRA